MTSKDRLQHHIAQIDQLTRELQAGAKSTNEGGWDLGNYSISGSHLMIESVWYLNNARQRLMKLVEVL